MKDIDFADDTLKEHFKKTDGYTTSAAYFVHGGVMYRFNIYGDAEETVPLLKQIVDSLK